MPDDDLKPLRPLRFRRDDRGGISREEVRPGAAPAVNPLMLVPDDIEPPADAARRVLAAEHDAYRREVQDWIQVGITSGQLPAPPARPPAMTRPARQAVPTAAPAPDVDAMTARTVVELGREIPRMDVPAEDLDHIRTAGEAMVDYAVKHGAKPLHLALELAFRRLDALQVEGAYQGVVTHVDGVMMRAQGVGAGGTSRILAAKLGWRVPFSGRHLVKDLVHYAVYRGQWIGFAIEGRRIVDLESSKPARFDMKRHLQGQGFVCMEGWPQPPVPGRLTWQATKVARALARIGYNAHAVMTWEGIQAWLIEDHRARTEEKAAMMAGGRFGLAFGAVGPWVKVAVAMAAVVALIAAVARLTGAT